MAKIEKQFEFIYPLTKKAVRNCKIVTEHVCDLTISGKAYEHTNISVLDEEGRYDVDIDAVEYNGTNILPVIETTELMDSIHEAAVAHAFYLFTSEKVA